MQSRKAASDNEVHKSLTSNVKMCSTGCKLNDLPGLTFSLHNMPEKLLKGVIGQKEMNPMMEVNAPGNAWGFFG